MKKIIYSTLLLIALVICYPKVVKTNPGAPPAGGLSGDPSRTTCALIGCHPSPEITFGTGELTLNLGLTQGSVTTLDGQSYTPGQTYFVELKPNVTNGGNSVYGFQCTALDAAGNMAGSFTVTDAAHTSAQSLLSRNYVGHKSASAFRDWYFQWTAPATNVGDVTLYYAVNAADGNGGTSGDKIYKGTAIIAAPGSSQVAPLSVNAFSLSIFPNPVHEQLNVSFDKVGNEKLEVNIFNVNGQLLLTQNENQLVSEKNILMVDLDERLTSGVYFLELKSASQRVTKKFVVN
jgi:hypothetical protein